VRSTQPPPTAGRPLTPSAPSVRSNVVPLRPAATSNEIGVSPSGAAAVFAPVVTPAPAAAAPMMPAPTPQPAPIPAPFVTTPQPVAAPFPPPATGYDTFAVVPPAAPSPIAPQAPYRESFHPPQPSFHPMGYEPEKRAGVPLWFWPILVLALGFGGGVAFLVFQPHPPPAPVVIQMPQPTVVQTAGELPDTTPPVSSSDPAPDTSERKAKAPVAKAAAPKPTEEKKGLDLGGRGQSTGGPAVGPGGPAAGPGGGLDQAGVERVVAGHRTGVKRTCWERGGADQKSSVNVTVTANVSPDGHVASTSSSGDDPVVAKCIETQVGAWKFPPPGSPTTINIPFKFVRQ